MTSIIELTHIQALAKGRSLRSNTGRNRRIPTSVGRGVNSSIISSLPPLTDAVFLCKRRPDMGDSSIRQRQGCLGLVGPHEFRDEASLVRLAVEQGPTGFVPEQMMWYPMQQM